MRLGEISYTFVAVHRSHGEVILAAPEIKIMNIKFLNTTRPDCPIVAKDRLF